MFLIFTLEGNLWKLYLNPHDENHPCCLLQGHGIFVHVWRLSTISTIQKCTQWLWSSEKNPPFPFQGSLNYPFWGDPGFVASFQIALSEPFEAIFWGCWSRKAGNLWIYKQVPKPPGPYSVGWLLHFDHVKFQKMETSRRGCGCCESGIHDWKPKESNE